MKQFIIFIITLTAPLSGISQIVVNNTNTVEWYVQNILLGSNVTVSNVTLTVLLEMSNTIKLENLQTQQARSGFQMA